MARSQAKFFGMDRIGRLRYFAYSVLHTTLSVLIFLLGFGILYIQQSSGLEWLTGVAIILFLWAAAFALILFPIFKIRRLHDLGQSGWWFLLTFAPLVGLALDLYLLFARGNDSSNLYGEPEPDSDGFMLWSLVVFCLILLIPMAVVYNIIQGV